MAVEFSSVRLSKALSVLIDDFKSDCSDNYADLSMELPTMAFSIQRFQQKLSKCYFQDRSMLSPSEDAKVRKVLGFAAYSYLQKFVDEAYMNRNNLFV